MWHTLVRPEQDQTVPTRLNIFMEAGTGEGWVGPSGIVSLPPSAGNAKHSDSYLVSVAEYTRKQPPQLGSQLGFRYRMAVSLRPLLLGLSMWRT